MALSANAQGQLKGKFTIPANVPAGRKDVVVVGAAGSRGGAQFVGEGTEVTLTKQNITTVLTTFYDPLAQTFSLDASEQVKAIDLFVTAKGTKPIRVQLRETAYGVPSQEILAESIVTAANITINGFCRFEFPVPVALSAGTEYAIVVLSEEATPSVGIAELSKYDSTAKQYVTSQPYQVGVLLSSSNASTWTPHQERDLVFRIIGMRYYEGSRTVSLGTINVTNCTEFRVQGQIESPVNGATGNYQIVLPNGTTYNVGNGQILSLPSPVTGVVTVRAVLTSATSHSAVLYPGTAVGAGRLAASADYVTPAIDGDALGCDVRVVFDAILPSGSTAAAYVSGVDAGDTWQLVPAVGVPVPLGDNKYEFSFGLDGVKEARVRMKLVLTGNAAARPRVSNLRVFIE